MPPYKLIILDEADSMTTDAQSALRRTMETHCRITRFCIICNYVSRLIPPIVSRCAKFHFKPLPRDLTIERLKAIAAQEGVHCERHVLELITDQAEGDLRKSIQTMQSLHRLAGNGEIAEQAVLDMSGAVPAAVLDGVLATCRDGQFADVRKDVDALLQQGYPAGQLVAQVCDAVVNSNVINDGAKAVICLALAEADKMLTDGANEFLQLLTALATVHKLSAAGGGKPF